MLELQIKPVKPQVAVQVPGSKSYTHRLLIAAALSDGPCRIANPLRSEDTLLTLDALQQMGIAVQHREDLIEVKGAGGRLAPCNQPIYLANAGTSMRLLGGVVVLGRGRYVLTGSPRMCQRPMQALLDSLQQIGVDARSQNNNGCPPVIIQGGPYLGGRTTIDCSVSSQFLSALLLIAPCLEQGLDIEVSHGPVSRPYVNMTVDIMQTCGVRLERQDYSRFQVSGGQTYRSGDYRVEPDASQAGYFWAAAAVTGSRVKVRGINAGSQQGDVGLAELFGRMGCRVDYDADGIAVTGCDLQAIEVDMGHMPDVVPTLAVVAAFARGTTHIRDVSHLRAKECDRLAAVTRELGKMGIETRTGRDELIVIGGQPHGAEIETYNDHRIAMSFAVAGLKVPGMIIADERCVDKSFPNFWEVFGELYV